MIMKRKIKSYLAFTPLPYRIFGLLLIPVLLLSICLGLPFERGNESFFYQILIFGYLTVYEIATDYWLLAGCLSDGGSSLRYFRTSHAGTEVVRNVVLVDLVRRFAICMLFAAVIAVLTGRAAVLADGLAMYCVIVGVLNGSRHLEGFQILMFIAVLSQVAVAAVSIGNYLLFWYWAGGSEILAILLLLLYGAAALILSGITIRRITSRVCRPQAETA